MKKISLDEFKSMLDADKELGNKFKSYLGDETDPEVLGDKTVEFLTKEGYEIDESTLELSMDDLEDVSGGRISSEQAKKFFRKVGKVAKTWVDLSGNYVKGVAEGFLNG